MLYKMYRIMTLTTAIAEIVSRFLSRDAGSSAASSSSAFLPA